MSLAGTIRCFIGLATDQLLPHQCLLCGRFCFDRGVCAACWDGTWPISAPLCYRCGRPLAHALPDHFCGQCWLAPADTFAPNMLQRRHHNKSQAGLRRAQHKRMSLAYSVCRINTATYHPTDRLLWLMMSWQAVPHWQPPRVVCWQREAARSRVLWWRVFCSRLHKCTRR